MRRVQYEYVHESAVIIRTACLSDAAERCKMYRYAAMYRGEWRIPQWMRFDERFEKELKRAEEFDSYIVMVVEGTVEEARQYCYKSPKHRRPNIDYSLHNLRGFLIQFARNFQVLFCDNRFEAQDMTKRILYFGEYIKNCDLQYGLDQRKARV